MIKKLFFFSLSFMSILYSGQYIVTAKLATDVDEGGNIVKDEKNNRYSMLGYDYLENKDAFIHFFEGNIESTTVFLTLTAIRDQVRGVTET